LWPLSAGALAHIPRRKYATQLSELRKLRELR